MVATATDAITANRFVGFCGGVFQFMLLQSLIAAVVVVDCGCHGG